MLGIAILAVVLLTINYAALVVQLAAESSVLLRAKVPVGSKDSLVYPDPGKTRLDSSRFGAG